MSCAGYMQIPARPECLQEAPGGHPEMKQLKAQYWSPVDGSFNMHSGVAVVPAGTSVGQGEVVQLGEQYCALSCFISGC